MPSRTSSAVTAVRRVALAGVALIAIPLLRTVPGPIDATGPSWAAAAATATAVGAVLVLVALLAWVLRLLLLEHADRVVRGLRPDDDVDPGAPDSLVDLLREDREERRASTRVVPFVDAEVDDTAWRRPASDA